MFPSLLAVGFITVLVCYFLHQPMIAFGLLWVLFLAAVLWLPISYLLRSRQQREMEALRRRAKL